MTLDSHQFSCKIQVRIYRSIGCGNGQAGTAFCADPVLVSQDRTGGKKHTESPMTGTVQGPEQMIDFKARTVDRMSFRIQKLFAVPLGSFPGLVNRKIENGFPYLFSLQIGRAHV